MPVPPFSRVDDGSHADVHSFWQKMDALVTLSNTTEANLIALTATVTGLVSAVSALGGHVSSVESAVSSVAASVASLSAKVTSLQSAIKPNSNPSTGSGSDTHTGTPPKLLGFTSGSLLAAIAAIPAPPTQSNSGGGSQSGTTGTDGGTDTSINRII